MPKKQSAGVQGTLPTPETYRFPGNEDNVYHVLQRKGGYDPATGEPVGEAFVQKYNQREFELYMKRSLELQGWELTILWDPNNKRQTAPAAAEK